MLQRSRLCLLLLCFVGGCSGGASTLETVLSKAKRDRRVSDKKIEIILKEYDSVRRADRSKARLYVDQIKSAVDAGGDSSHIDVVRRLVLRSEIEGT